MFLKVLGLMDFLKLLKEMNIDFNVFSFLKLGINLLRLLFIKLIDRNRCNFVRELISIDFESFMFLSFSF